jgi:hypothetical protein
LVPGVRASPEVVGLLRVIRRIRGMGVRKEMGRGRMGMTLLLYNEW